MAEVTINNLGRIEGASVKEISIGGKTLKSLQTIPKFQIKSDIDLFLDNIKNLPEFGGVAFDLWSIPSIYQSITLSEGQRNLDNLAKAITPAKKMIDKRICIIDPNTEWYRYKYITEIEKKKDGTIIHTKQTDIFNQRGFPKSIKEIFLKKGTEGHNIAWKEIEKENLLLSFVLWHIEQNLKYNSNLIIPPAPLVDGTNQNMLTIVEKINKIAKELTFEDTDVFGSFYLPIHPDVFVEDDRCTRVLQTIKNNLMVNTILVLKFFRVKNAIIDPSSRARLSRFLSTLDNLKQSYLDNIAIIALDTSEEGMALMSNGIDIACDPLGGVKDKVPFRKSKKDSKKDSSDGHEEQIEINPFKSYGKYVHPETREYTKITDLMNMLDGKGNLPHDCYACKQLHGRLINKKDKKFPNFNEWNLHRRLHNFTFRREEDLWLSNAVIDNNIKAPEIYLSKRTRADKNLVDILPSSIFELK